MKQAYGETVTTTAFSKKVGYYYDEAIRRPIGLERHGEVRVVMVPVDEYNSLRKLFARALQRPRTVLIADEPTRGVDVGSRRAIYDLIVAEASRGIGVIVVSSDVEEVLGLAHRILVIRSGRIVAELSGDERTEENVLTAAFADPITSGKS